MPSSTTGGKVKGVPQLRRKLDRMADELEDLTPEHEPISRRMLANVKRRTRRRSGRLAGEWTARATPRAAVIVNPLEYAGVQESGWPAHNIEATLAIPAAVADEQEGILGDYSAGMDRRIRKIGGAP